MPDEESLKKLGKRIAKLRLKKGLTQTELAYRCDFERPNLARIEAGNTNPTYLTLLKIATSLEIPVIDLIDID